MSFSTVFMGKTQLHSKLKFLKAQKNWQAHFYCVLDLRCHMHFCAWSMSLQKFWYISYISLHMQASCFFFFFFNRQVRCMPDLLDLDTVQEEQIHACPVDTCLKYIIYVNPCKIINSTQNRTQEVKMGTMGKLPFQPPLLASSKTGCADRSWFSKPGLLNGLNTVINWHLAISCFLFILISPCFELLLPCYATGCI